MSLCILLFLCAMLILFLVSFAICVVIIFFMLFSWDVFYKLSSIVCVFDNIEFYMGYDTFALQFSSASMSNSSSSLSVLDDCCCCSLDCCGSICRLFATSFSCL